MTVAYPAPLLQMSGVARRLANIEWVRTEVSTMKMALLTSMLFLSSPGIAEPPPDVAQWAARHATASDALSTWIRDNPEGARQLFWWDRTHPLRARFFVRWFVDHPDARIDDFSSQFSDLPAVKLVLKPNQPAFEAFIAWVRAHPAAASDLSAHLRGVSWVGFHVYRDLWDAKAAPPPSDPSPDKAN
jgi:hypothetical protein